MKQKKALKVFDMCSSILRGDLSIVKTLQFLDPPDMKEINSVYSYIIY